jgi:shikimate kinase
MSISKTNIILLGMPGAGKSTVGVLAAKRNGMGFIDTDILIQQEQHRPLQWIIDTEGYRRLREIEEEVLVRLDTVDTVIATGGSAVYSKKAMEHLKKNGIALFLDTAVEELHTRVGDYSTRGIAKEPGQTFEQLFAERTPLYRHYADFTINSETKGHERIAQEIIDIYIEQTAKE